MKCLRCGSEIPETRHLCDDCKKEITEREKKQLLFSPSNKNVKKDVSKVRTIAFAVFCIALATIICVLLSMLIGEW